MMDGGKFPATVLDLLATPEGRETVEDAAQFALKKLLDGMGRFGADGSFMGSARTFGEPFNPVHDAHRMVRNALLETIAYMQGTAFAFDYLDRLVGGLQADPHFEYLFEESHWNRSKMLLNVAYKGQAGSGPGYMTLSQLTEVSLKNEFRNRKALRENVVPVFKRFAIWTMTNGNAENSWNFTPGPFLLLFHERVLTPFMIQKRDQ